MKKRYKIEVIQFDIDNGVKSGDLCPIALSIKRCYNLNKVSVGRRSIGFLDTNNNLMNFKLPLAAQKFVEIFDSGGRVYPFSFCISKPSYLKLFYA